VPKRISYKKDQVIFTKKKGGLAKEINIETLAGGCDE
jgi:hypothetical protein